MEVSLAYDLDGAHWPWLSLPPHHPVLVEKYQYFSSMTAGWAVLDHEPTVHSALTRMSWRCEPASFIGQHASRGHCRLWQDKRDMGYELSTLNADDQRVTHYSGTGFAFADRDFKAWRAKTRQAALSQAGTPEIEFADLGSVGLNAIGASFVSRLHERDGQAFVMACVSTQRGFYPAHPFHTGSGDHVNAGHLFDCALQAAHLFLGAGTVLTCTGGAAEFKRFVELDVPFVIRLADRKDDQNGERLSMQMEQLGRVNAVVTLQLRSQDSAAP